MRWVIILCTALLLIGSASADLIITPNPVDVTTKLNNQSTFVLTFYNSFDFRIQQFEFKNLTGFTIPEILLEANETKNVTISVLMNQLRSEQIASQVSFKYLVDIPPTPQTHYVNITLNGFSPDYLTIHEGDTVVWTNVDDISHTVTGGSYDYELQPNGTVSRQFDTVGTDDYQDLILFWAGTIEVLNRSAPQYVNNPNYNTALTINLEVLTDPTTLSVNIVEKSFSIDPTVKTEGILSVENTGDQIAQKIHLSTESDWIRFKENDFTLDKGTKKFVAFEIQPIVFSSNETNKTYNFPMKIKALNSQLYEDNISVFVKYSDVFDDITSNEGFLNWFRNVYCPANPNLFICNTNASTGGEPRVIVRDPEIPVNLTASQLYAALKRIQRIEDSNQRTNNKLNTLSESLETNIPEQNRLLNETLNKVSESEEKRKTNETVTWIVVIFVIIIGGFIAGFKYIENWQRKKYLMGGK